MFIHENDKIGEIKIYYATFANEIVSYYSKFPLEKLRSISVIIIKDYSQDVFEFLFLLSTTYNHYFYF